MRLDGQVALVTGAAGNLGLAISKRFAAAGATVVMTDLHQDAVTAAANAAGLDPQRHLALAADVTDEASAQQLVEAVLARFGRLDILANIAGGFRMGPPVHETPLATWDFMMTLNARSVLVMAHAAVPAMITGQRGRIVSVSARAALKGDPHMAAYSASKAAVMRLTESMAAELAPHGITVNCVLPSIIDTPQNREAMPQADASTWVAPDSLAEVIAFLASDGGRDITGAAIPVYGRA